MARKPWYEGPWKKVRRQVLERDNHLCQIGSAGCTRNATEVDHVLPVSMGGAWYDPDNLRASCRWCNLQRNRKTTAAPSRTW